MSDRPDALTVAMVDGVRGALRRSLALSGMDEWWTRAATQDRMTTWKEQAGA